MPYDRHYTMIRDAGNLLSALVRDRARYVRAPKTDPLMLRYADLKPRILLYTDYESTVAEAEGKLRRPLGWRPTKAENRLMKTGTTVDPMPKFAPPIPDPDTLYLEITALIRAFPTQVLRDPQFAERLAKI